MSGNEEMLKIGHQPPLRVLFEDHSIVVVNKYWGQLFQGLTKGTPTSLAEQVKEYLAEKKERTGNIFLGIVHRLDRPVSGVVVFAKSSKFASRMSEQFSERSVGKKYLAIVKGKIGDASGEWTDELAELNENDDEVGPVKECRLACRVVGESSSHSLVEIELMTGRRHQIRRQFARRGHPIVGDVDYGGESLLGGMVECDERFRPIGLHSWELVFSHPLSFERQSVRANPPQFWRPLITSLGFSAKMTLDDLASSKI